MKKTITVGLGGRNFTVDEDAYILLDNCINAYAATLDEDRKEVMEEVEMRIADLLRSKMNEQEVVNCEMVESVTREMGLPEGSTEKSTAQTGTRHRFYRDTDDRKIGGVCGGLAAYFDVDVTLLRILAVVMLFCGGVGFWFYIICCIVAPNAYTAAEKCELRGMPCTVDNLRKFTSKSN